MRGRLKHGCHCTLKSSARTSDDERNRVSQNPNGITFTGLSDPAGKELPDKMISITHPTLVSWITVGPSKATADQAACTVSVQQSVLDTRKSYYVDVLCPQTSDTLKNPSSDTGNTRHLDISNPDGNTTRNDFVTMYVLCQGGHENNLAYQGRNG
jgi:hypothetical protein